MALENYLLVYSLQSVVCKATFPACLAYSRARFDPWNSIWLSTHAVFNSVYDVYSNRHRMEKLL